MIKIEDVHFSYPNGNEVLRGIDLEIGDGEFVAIMGENGAGKTTLVKMFNGLLKPSKGKITVNGINTTHTSVA
ncbi:MAG: ATP-binding cassette domain-containing protein, partial [archaeon]